MNALKRIRNINNQVKSAANDQRRVKLLMLLPHVNYQVVNKFIRKWMEQNERFLSENCSICDIIENTDQYQVVDKLQYDCALLCNSEIGRNFLKVNLVNKTKSHLRWVHSYWAGIDDYSHMQEFKELKYLQITNAKGVFTQGVSEYVMSQILFHCKQLGTFLKMKQEKTWVETSFGMNQLKGQNLGLIGFGDIGKGIAKIAKTGFEMNVFAYKKDSEGQGQEHTYTDKIFYQHNNLNELLQNSDYVVNLLPLTNETNNFFNKQHFRQMKKTGIFINVGRGQTTNEGDLITAIETRIIGGASLDVFQIEPLPAKNKLWNFDNVFITPHCGGHTVLVNDGLIQVFKENLHNFVNGKQLTNICNLDKGY